MDSENSRNKNAGDSAFVTYVKNKISRFGQFLYLTVSNFTKNSLFESASSCAFGFIFSFIPIVLIIFTVLVGILRIYPNIYNFIVDFFEQMDYLVKVTPILDKMLEIRSLSSFNIFIGIWVIWMARKLFNSIIGAMNKVFRSVSKRKSWFNQVLTFIIEFIITLLIALVITAAFAFTQIISLPFFQTILAQFTILFKQSSHNLGTFIIYFILFISTVIAYRIIPGTKPLLRRCFFYAFLNTLAFFIVSQFLNKFMNVTNYNAVYGTISSLVVLMMKVYLFFIIFLFCAQMIYVSQFFDPLLRSAIYDLPASSSKGWGNYLRRFLFINPTMIQTEENTVQLKAGETLYSENEKVQAVWYILEGSILETSSQGEIERHKGNFLGDVQCIVNETYRTNAKALTDSTLIRFSDEEFMDILQKSHHSARKAISKISSYTESFYSEDEEVLL